ncbi:MAG: helix-turn-helix transcriptional regulator [Bacteroidia bacterium]
MLTKKELFKTKEYWIVEMQDEIYRQVHDYMQKNNFNQNELADRWNVSKGYISQILKGDCNFSLKKLVELSLALDKAPIVKYVETGVYFEIDKISRYMEEQRIKPSHVKNENNKVIVFKSKHVSKTSQIATIGKNKNRLIKETEPELLVA